MIVKIVKKDDEYYTCDKLVDDLNKNPQVDECGAIYTFTGFVRGKEEGETIRKLTLTTPDRERAENEMQDISESVKIKYGVKQVNIIHYIGEFYTGDPLFQVAVLGKHRQETVNALSEVIEKVKHEIDFKKEIETSDGVEVILAGG